jgi:excisionase family DNA binding protein
MPTTSRPALVRQDLPTSESTRDPYALLTVQEVADLLKVSTSWVYEHTRSRGSRSADYLPFVKLGKYIRFEPRLVHEFVARHTRQRVVPAAQAATIGSELQHEEPTREKG